MDKYDIYAKKLGVRIYQLRKNKGMNQVVFGDSIGIDERHLRDLEKGKTNPKLTTLHRIASFLEMDLTEFLSLDDIQLDDLPKGGN